MRFIHCVIVCINSDKPWQKQNMISIALLFLNTDQNSFFIFSSKFMLVSVSMFNKKKNVNYTYVDIQLASYFTAKNSYLFKSFSQIFIQKILNICQRILTQSQKIQHTKAIQKTFGEQVGVNLSREPRSRKRHNEDEVIIGVALEIFR